MFFYTHCVFRFSGVCTADSRGRVPGERDAWAAEVEDEGTSRQQLTALGEQHIPL